MATSIPHQTPPLSTPNISVLGTTLCHYAESIYQDVERACTLLENVRRQPSRSLNAVYACYVGIKLFAAGSCAGPVGLLIGGREIYNLSRQPKANTVHDILSSINVKVQTIGTLAENQEKHLVNIEDKLESIKKDVEGLQTNLSTIRSMNALGIEGIRDAQKNAHTLNRRAMKAYLHAQEAFTDAKNTSAQAKACFDDAALCFIEVLTLAQSDQPDLSLIKAKAAEALSLSKEGQELLCESEKLFLEAFSTFQEANALKTEALSQILITTEKAKQVMIFNREKAAIVVDFNSRFAAIHKELNEAKKEIVDILVLINRLREQLVHADNAVRAKLDAADLIAGVMTTAVAAPIAGPITAVTIGVSAAYGLHYRDSIVNTAKNVYGFLFGEFLQPLVALRKGEIVRAEFDLISSGKWGAYIQNRPSHTVGTIHLDVGDSIDALPLRFNLNNEYPVSELDLLNLNHLLTKKVENQNITPQQCLNIINKLRMENRINSVDHVEKTIVILRQDDILFNRLEALCIKQING